MIERLTIRNVIQRHAHALESAQASGTLARSKLALKDAAAEAFPDEQGLRFSEIFNEELEAFCSDRPMANVTVQTQVERREPNTGLAMAAAFLAYCVSIVVEIVVFHVEPPGAGFTLALVPAIITYYVVR